MHLYQGTSEQFIADAVQARLANQLADLRDQGIFAELEIPMTSGRSADQDLLCS